MPYPRILISDDHPMYLDAVRIRLSRMFPEAVIVDQNSLSGALSACQEAAARSESFDLVLLDYAMPGVDGPDGIASFIAQAAAVPVAIMSGSATLENAQALIRVGARGFLPKTLSSEQFAAAVQALLTGATYLPTDLLLGLIGPQPPQGSDVGPADGDHSSRKLIDSLTPRERGVLALVAAGRSNKEIGRELDIAEPTVKLHVRQILKRTGLRNRVEAAAMATKLGLG